MKKVVLIATSFFIALLFLMPKENLYYTLKRLLSDQHIQLTQKKVSDRWYALHLEGVSLLYDGIESVEIEKVDLWPWLFYNRLDLQTITPYPAIRKFLPASAKEMVVSYTPFYPMKATMRMEGEFGEMEGFFEIKTGKLHLLLHPASPFAKSSIVRQNFKKTEEGYLYESILY